MHPLRSATLHAVRQKYCLKPFGILNRCYVVASVVYYNGRVRGARKRRPIYGLWTSSCRWIWSQRWRRWPRNGFVDARRRRRLGDWPATSSTTRAAAPPPGRTIGVQYRCTHAACVRTGSQREVKLSVNEFVRFSGVSPTTRSYYCPIHTADATQPLSWVPSAERNSWARMCVRCATNLVLYADKGVPSTLRLGLNINDIIR